MGPTVKNRLRTLCFWANFRIYFIGLAQFFREICWRNIVHIPFCWRCQTQGTNPGIRFSKLPTIPRQPVYTNQVPCIWKNQNNRIIKRYFWWTCTFTCLHVIDHYNPLVRNISLDFIFFFYDLQFPFDNLNVNVSWIICHEVNKKYHHWGTNFNWSIFPKLTFINDMINDGSVHFSSR